MKVTKARIDTLSEKMQQAAYRAASLSGQGLKGSQYQKARQEFIAAERDYRNALSNYNRGVEVDG
jgi:hypothetical protein